MMRYFRMVAFHLGEFARVPFFVSLMATSTLGILAIQALAYYAWGGDSWVAWMRSGIVGMWTTTTVAAGILGFERFKGTLVHLFSARINVLSPAAAVVSAASVFGLLSFAVAWLAWGLLWIATDVGHGTPPVSGASVAVSILLLWVSCLSISFVMAALFVLTPNAIAYEELLLIPVFILSGLVFTSTDAPPVLHELSYIIPLSAPTQVLLGQVPEGEVMFRLLVGLGVTACWFAASYWLGKSAIRKARSAGTLAVI